MLQYLQFVLLLTHMLSVSPFHGEDAGQRLSSPRRNMLFKGDKIFHDTESPNSSTICRAVFDTKLFLVLLTRSFYRNNNSVIKIFLFPYFTPVLICILLVRTVIFKVSQRRCYWSLWRTNKLPTYLKHNPCWGSHIFITVINIPDYCSRKIILLGLLCTDKSLTT